MTRRSVFKEHKNVLVFNDHRVLDAIHKSLNTASRTMNIPAQAISLCCLGRHVSCFGYYFRHYEFTRVEITPHVDLGALRLEEYDKMCGAQRRYHDKPEMRRLRASAEKRRDNNHKNDKR